MNQIDTSSDIIEIRTFNRTWIKVLDCSSFVDEDIDKAVPYSTPEHEAIQILSRVRGDTPLSLLDDSDLGILITHCPQSLTYIFRKFQHRFDARARQNIGLALLGLDLELGAIRPVVREMRKQSETLIDQPELTVFAEEIGNYFHNNVAPVFLKHAKEVWQAIDDALDALDGQHEPTPAILEAV